MIIINPCENMPKISAAPKEHVNQYQWIRNIIKKTTFEFVDKIILTTENEEQIIIKISSNLYKSQRQKQNLISYLSMYIVVHGIEVSMISIIPASARLITYYYHIDSPKERIVFELQDELTGIYSRHVESF